MKLRSVVIFLFFSSMLGYCHLTKAQSAAEDSVLFLRYDSIGFELYSQNKSDEAKLYLHKILEIAERQKWNDIWAEYMLNLRIFESFAGNFLEAKVIFEKLVHRESLGDIQAVDLRQKIFDHYAIFLFEIGDYEGALVQLDNLKNLRKALEIPKEEFTVTSQIAIKTGQFNKAIELAKEELRQHQENLALRDANPDFFDFRQVALEKNLGQVYLEANRLPQAETHLLKAHQGFLKLPARFRPLALEQSLSRNLALLADKKGEIAEAEKLSLIRVNTLESDSQINLLERLNAYTYQAELNIRLGRPKDAQDWIDKAKNLLKELGKNPLDFPEWIAQQVDLWHSEGNASEAIQLYTSYYNHSRAFPLQSEGHAKLLLAMAKIKSDPTSWLEFYRFFGELSSRIGNSVLPSYAGLIAKANSTALANLQASYEKQPNPELWKAALDIIEFNLAFETSQRLIANTARLNFKLPIEVLNAERDVQAQLLLYQHAEKNNRGTNEKLEQLYRRQDSLKTVLIKKYPSYYALRYPGIGNDLGELYSHAGNFITYYYDDAQLFRIGKMGDDRFFDHIAFPQPERLMKSYIASISKPENNDRHIDLGVQIFSLLLGNRISKTDAFSVIPYGKINGIPFQAIKSSPESDYLVASHRIGYHTSLGKLLQSSGPRIALRFPKFQVFAPFAAGSDTDPSRQGDRMLPGTLAELEGIASSFPIEKYTGMQASKSLFVSKAAREPFIHLATHAVYPDLSEDPAWITFQSESGNEKLFAYELYNADIPADFVGLSACKTGLGNFVTGLGHQSLGSAFSYAGVKGLLASLWEINDQSTAEIIDQFYAQLERGAAKDLALQRAQIRYLNNHQGLRTHPYYWAGLIIQGETAPITPTPPIRIVMITAGILLIVGLILLFRRFLTPKRNSKTANQSANQ